jgi:hypothetical protein
MKLQTLSNELSKIASEIKLASEIYILYGNGCKLTVETHPKNKLEIQELNIEGQKIKRKLRKTGLNLFAEVNNFDMNNFLAENFVRFFFKFNKRMTYDQAKDAMLKAYYEAKKDNLATLNPSSKSYAMSIKPQMWETEVFYLEIPPQGYHSIEVKGKDFVLKSEWNKFESYSPSSDFQQSDPYYSIVKNKSARDARKLHLIVSKDPNIFRSVSWNELDNTLKTKLKINVDYEHSVWH